jgi:hypothetical protein
MALMTLATLLRIVRHEIPGKDQPSVVDAVNMVIRRVHTDTVEPQRTTFTTKAQATTGTVAIAQDATLATFTGLATALAATDPLTLVQIDGDSTWFPLTYASASTGNLSSKWAEATVAAATFTLVYPTASFPNTVGEVLNIFRGSDKLAFRPGGGCPWGVGSPMSWSPYRHDEASAAPSDDLTRVWLDPAPTDRQALVLEYRPRTPAIATDAATTVTIPFTDLWEEAIVEATLEILWGQESDGKTRVALKHARAENALARARGGADPAGVIPRTNRLGPSGGFGWTDQRPIGG